MNRNINNSAEVNKNVLYMFKGMIIGGTMLVPGVSGGSMAMILGIYDKMISSVSSFMKDKRGSFTFLLLCAAGGCLGMFLFSKPLLHLIETYPMPTLYFFIGAVIGGVPLIFGKSKLRKFSIRGLFYIFMGAVIVLAMTFIPMEAGDSATQDGFVGAMFLLLAGFIAAVALVLPGISVSFLLLVLGLYDETVNAISQMYLPYLIPLGVGLLIGIFLTTRILESAMEAFPQPTYLMILGFVLGSIAEVFPGVPSGVEILLCVLTFAAGCGAILLLSYSENKKEIQQNKKEREDAEQAENKK